MATLTETAYYTRKGIKYGAIALVVFLVFRFIWGITSAYLRKIHPPPPPPPTVSFGKLPKIDFPKKEGLPTLSFKLETIQGAVPKLDSISKVYFSVKPGATLLSLDRAKETAKKMGFSTNPQALSSKTYRFQTQTTPPTSLDIDIITLNFKLYYDFSSDQTILTEKKLPSNDQAISEAKSFLSSAGLLAQDLSLGKAQVSYLKYQAPNLMPAISLSEADFVKVGLFREDLGGLPILPENPKEGSITFLFSGARAREKRIVEINYNYNKIERESFATYPLKSAQTAWQELQGGKGFIASLGENTDGKITVRKVYLAYFDSPQPQNFLQPIFVFEGDRDFFAYVSAVDSKWIE
ncbi:MAG: hypothetical protein ACOZBZ_01480 [Patescibacteria group bacterium]